MGTFTLSVYVSSCIICSYGKDERNQFSMIVVQIHLSHQYYITFLVLKRLWCHSGSQFLSCDVISKTHSYVVVPLSKAFLCVNKTSLWCFYDILKTKIE